MHASVSRRREAKTIGARNGRPLSAERATIEWATPAGPVCSSKLIGQIRNATNRQVSQLDVHLVSDGVAVTGVSRSYYVKQLVTKAVLDSLPGICLRNEIQVVTA